MRYRIEVLVTLKPGLADPQGKAVGEWLRSRVVDIPEELLA